jgi:hypothetical protein
MLPRQEANLIANLTPQQRRADFLSARFSEEQFIRMNRDAAMAVAEDGVASSAMPVARTWMAWG